MDIAADRHRLGVELLARRTTPRPAHLAPEASSSPSQLAQLVVNLDGAPPRLAAFRGAPCVNLFASEMRRAARRDAAADRRPDNPDIAFVGVATQDQLDKALQMAERTAITYPWVQDPDGDFFYAARAAGMPTTLADLRRGRGARRQDGQLLEPDRAPAVDRCLPRLGPCGCDRDRRPVRAGLHRRHGGHGEPVRVRHAPGLPRVLPRHRPGRRRQVRRQRRPGPAGGRGGVGRVPAPVHRGRRPGLVDLVQRRRLLPVAHRGHRRGAARAGHRLPGGLGAQAGLPRLDKGGPNRGLWSMFLFGLSYAIASLSCTIGPFTSRGRLHLLPRLVRRRGRHLRGLRPGHGAAAHGAHHHPGAGPARDGHPAAQRPAVHPADLRRDHGLPVPTSPGTGVYEIR